MVESRHRGSAAVCDEAGRIVMAWGDVERPIYARSALKPLQALPLVASGAADAFGLSDAELALACGSHHGEPAHVERVQGWLHRIGCQASDLECGAHRPIDPGRCRGARARGRSAVGAAQQLLGQARGVPDHGAASRRADARLHRGRASGAAPRHRGGRGDERPRPVARAARHRRLRHPGGGDPAFRPRAGDGAHGRSTGCSARPRRRLAAAVGGDGGRAAHGERQHRLRDGAAARRGRGGVRQARRRGRLCRRVAALEAGARAQDRGRRRPRERGGAGRDPDVGSARSAPRRLLRSPSASVRRCAMSRGHWSARSARPPRSQARSRSTAPGL